MFTSSFRSGISLSWALLTNEKRTSRITSCTSVRYSLSCEVRRRILNLAQGKEDLSEHITTNPDIAKATHASWKRLISLKVDYADLKLDMSILLPAKLHILSEGHKFLFLWLRQCKAILNARRRELEKTNEKELNDSLESEEDLMRNSIILDF